MCVCVTQDELDLYESILKADVLFPPSSDVIVAPDAMDLIEQFLRRKPSERIKLKDVGIHPFINRNLCDIVEDSLDDHMFDCMKRVSL